MILNQVGLSAFLDLQTKLLIVFLDLQIKLLILFLDSQTKLTPAKMNSFFDTPTTTSTAVLPGDSTIETKARIQNVFADFIRDFRFANDFAYRLKTSFNVK